MDIRGRVKCSLLHFTCVESLTSLQLDWPMLGAASATAPCPLVMAQTESPEMALNLVRFNQAETFVYSADSLPSPSVGECVFTLSQSESLVACFVCGMGTSEGLK